MQSSLLVADLPSEVLIRVTCALDTTPRRKQTVVSHDAFTSLAYLLAFRNECLAARVVCRLRCACRELEAKLTPCHWPTGRYPVVLKDTPAFTCEKHDNGDLKRVHALVEMHDHYAYRRDDSMARLAGWAFAFVENDTNTRGNVEPSIPHKIRMAVMNRIIDGCTMYPYCHERGHPRTEKGKSLKASPPSFTITELSGDTGVGRLTMATVSNVAIPRGTHIHRRGDNGFVAIGQTGIRLASAVNITVPMRFIAETGTANDPPPPHSADVLQCVRKTEAICADMMKHAAQLLLEDESMSRLSLNEHLFELYAARIRTCCDHVLKVYTGKTYPTCKCARDQSTDFVDELAYTTFTCIDYDGGDVHLSHFLHTDCISWSIVQMEMVSVMRTVLHQWRLQT